jgi:hypothetical protein
MRAILLLSVAALLGSSGSAAPKTQQEEVSLDVTPETTVPVSIGKGKEINAVINLNGLDGVYLSYADAQQLKAAGSEVGSFNSHDKSIVQGTMSQRYTTGLLGKEKQLMFYWPKTKPRYTDPSQMGPEALGVDFLSMRIGPPRTGEVTFGLKLIRFSKLFPNWNLGVGTLARIGDQTVSVKFDPSSEKSYALGTVGRRIAVHLGGHFVEPPEIPPESNFHAVDQSYRIRKMTMGSPTVLGALAIGNVYISESEGPDGKIIPDHAPINDEDPAFEIVVEAMKREPRHRSYPKMVLGQDVLSQCSNIAFDFAQEMIYLSCLPHGLTAPIQLSPQGAYFAAKTE